jgi:hypothetical protein
MATKVNIGSTDIGTTTNLTLSASMDNYDLLAFKVTNPSTSDGELIILPVQAAMGTALRINHNQTTYQMFDLVRRSTTTFTADNGTSYSITTGASAGIVPTGITTIDVEKIYGIKL